MKRKGLWRWRVIIGSYRGRHDDYEVADTAKVRAIFLMGNDRLF